MVTNNLNNFNTFLSNPKSPLFQLEAILVVPEIALHLNEKEITKLFIQSIKDCIET
jgi:hypothetical protein